MTFIQVIPNASWVVSPAHAEWGNSNYHETQTSSPAPAGTFAAGKGGDGWGISVYGGKVYNIYHNSGGVLTLDCHNRADGRPCWNTGSAAVASGWTGVSYVIQHQANTSASATHTLLPAYGPGQWIDPTTGMLYAYAVDQVGSVYTPGIVKLDTSKIDPTNLYNHAATFTALAATTVNCSNSVGNNCLTPTIQLNRKVFAVNFVNATYSTGQSNDANKLMCFNVDTGAACSGSPIVLPHVNAAVGTKYQPTQVGTFGNDLLIPLWSGSGSATLECYDTLAMAACSGWTAPSDSGFSGNGGAFPMLDSTGATTGVCVPDSTLSCYNMTGTKITTPTGLTNVIPNKSNSRNGNALVIGTRVFVPMASDNYVHCIDWAASGLVCSGITAAGFNAGTAGASGVYTVGSDANDPTCIWLNSDKGTSSYTVPGSSPSIVIAGVGQIQSFDAYSGLACGHNGVRVLLANFLAPGAACTPRSYTSIQLSTPDNPSYSTDSLLTGTVQFLNAAGNQLYDTTTPTPLIVANAIIGATGNVPLPTNINSLGGVVPILQINLSHNGTAYTGSVSLTFAWVSSADPACTPAGYSTAPYTISFDPNGAPDATIFYETITQGSAISTAVLETSTPWSATVSTTTPGIPGTDPTWSGTPFLGWFTAPSGGTAINTSVAPSGNVTYYAHWTMAGFTVIFDSNGGVTLSPNSESITVGSNLTGGSLNVDGGLPIPVWSDGSKVFTGWFDATSGGNAVTTTTNPGVSSGGSVTYYAHWAIAIVAVTNPATAITTNSATLNGAINTATPDTAFFCEDDTIFDSSTVTQNPFSCNNANLETLTASAANSSYTFAMTGLSPNTTYYFMQVGVQYGTVFTGAVLTFRTLAEVAPTPPPAPTLLTPTITWPNPSNQTGPYNLSPLQLNAVCSVPGSVLSYSPALGTTLQPGTYILRVTCTPPAGSGYGPLTTTVPFTVIKPVGNITWPTPSPVEGPATLDPSELNAVCSIPGATLTYSPALGAILSAGTRTLHVICTPPAGSPYDPLNAVVQLIVKEKTRPVPPVITIEPPVNPTMQLASSTTSTVTWEKSPNALGYYVTLDGSKVCTTYVLSCTFRKLVGPNSDVKIYATKGQLTSTFVVPTLVKGDKPQVIGIVYFDTAKYNIRQDQQAEINRVAAELQKLGYTDVVIGGHTDTNAYDNMTLSNNRAKTTKSALGKLVPGLNVDLHYSGATQPMATNSTISGQAKNRRAEISVW